MRSMSSASSPSGSKPVRLAGLHDASQSVAASFGWQKSS